MPISSTPTGTEIAAEYGITKAGSKGTDYLGKNGIPSGLPLKGSDFIGKSNTVVALAGGFSSDSRIGPGAATAGWYFYNNGNISRYEANGGGYTAAGTWITGGGATPGNDYQIEFTLTSSSGVASYSGVPLGWTDIGSSKAFTLSYGGTAGFGSIDVRVRIRKKGTTTVLATATYSCSVDKDF